MGEKPMSEPAWFDGTINSLIDLYRSHPNSRYQKVSFATKQLYDIFIKRISADYGSMRLSQIRNRDTVRDWHEKWSASGALSMAAGLAKMVQTLISFGAFVLKDGECERLRTTLHRLIARHTKPQRDGISPEQVVALRKKANAMGLASIALIQALQHDTPLRQKEIIGEWRPIDDLCPSEIVDDQAKWLRGLLWSEIDNFGRIRHPTLNAATIQADLRAAPMVLEEIERNYPGAVVRDPSGHTSLDRSFLPASGPVALSEYTGLPWKAIEFRRRWRKVADEVGIPKSISNSDSSEPRDLVSSRLIQSQTECHRLRTALQIIREREPGSEVALIAGQALAGSVVFGH
jgi:hypothetical protein